MKYCSKCGAELQDNAVFCSKCGAKCDQPQPEVESEVVENYSKPKSKIRRRDDTVMEIAEVFCVICTVLAGFAIIPLCWMIPLTVALHNKIKNKEPISVALKVVILLFVSVIGGILILVGDDSEE